MKRQFAAVVMVLLGIAGAGCSPSHGPSEAPTFLAGEGGSVVHQPSGIELPARVGELQREHTHAYAPHDVRIAYKYAGPDGAVAATSYINRSPKLDSIGSEQDGVARATQDGFERGKEELTRTYPQAVVVSEGPFSTAEGSSGLMAEYEYYGLFAGIVQPVKSRLYVLTHVNGSWALKHRITFPAGAPYQSKVDQYVRDFGPAK